MSLEEADDFFDIVGAQQQVVIGSALWSDPQRSEIQSEFQIGNRELDEPLKY